MIAEGPTIVNLSLQLIPMEGQRNILEMERQHLYSQHFSPLWDNSHDPYNPYNLRESSLLRLAQEKCLVSWKVREMEAKCSFLRRFGDQPRRKPDNRALKAKSF